MTHATSIKAAVLGGGAWGTTFAKVLADAGCSVTLWAREVSVADGINHAGVNGLFLPGVTLPAGIRATADAPTALADAELIVVAIPSQVARVALEPMAPFIPDEVPIVSLMKGVELATGKLMSDVVVEALGVDPARLAVVSGPNLAREIAAEEPTATVVASSSPETAATVMRACAAPYFRPYTNDDVVGVELCGAVKNVIALAVGVAQGLGHGWNTSASLITRGLREITRLGLALGARPETFAGLAGMGDLVATCASPLSRNNTLGRHLGQGMTLDEALAATGGTAEGVKTSQSVLALATQHNVEMPITSGVVAVVTGALPVEELGKALLSRPQKAEAV